MTRTADPRLSGLLSELRAFLRTPGNLIGVTWTGPDLTLSGNYDTLRPAFPQPELHLSRGVSGTASAHTLRVPLTAFTHVTRHAADADHPVTRYHLRRPEGHARADLHLVLLDVDTLARHTCPHCQSLFTLGQDVHDVTREVNLHALICHACGEAFTPGAEPASMHGAAPHARP